MFIKPPVLLLQMANNYKQGYKQSTNQHFHDNISKKIKINESPSWIPESMEISIIPTLKKNIINFFCLSNIFFFQFGSTAFREIADAFILEEVTRNVISIMGNFPSTFYFPKSKSGGC
jgi:hypothetical protein